MHSSKMQKRSHPESIEAFLDQASAERVEQATTETGHVRARLIPKKLKAFNLPVELIQRIEAEAEIKTAGNASALAVRIFESYFEDIDSCR